MLKKYFFIALLGSSGLVSSLPAEVIVQQVEKKTGDNVSEVAQMQNANGQQNTYQQPMPNPPPSNNNAVNQNQRYSSYGNQQQNAYTNQVPDSSQPQNAYLNQAPGQIQWMMNYKQAANLARQQNKYILLFFTGSDWCGWCKKMESEVFSDPGFINALGNRFVFVEVDFPMNKTLPGDISQQNIELKQEYGITGYPTIVILDPNQNFVDKAGYRPGGGREYAKYLLALIPR